MMIAKDKLEELALANGWGFDYGRSDYHNLKDASAFQSDSVEGYTADETILFCDPIKVSDLPNDITSSIGSLMILTRSNFDKTYSERYDLFIKPLLVAAKSFKDKLKCDWDIVRWEKTEVINIFDINADGLLISFTMNGYE